MRRYDALPAGLKIANRFVINARIGSGHFAAVYQAVDLTSATSVALKVLNPWFAEDPIATERFVREVQVLRRVHHPNIVKVYDVFREDQWSIICMEWFDGLDCRAYLDRNGPLPVADFLPVAQTLVAALQACHRLKIVHRDLKPQNVLINARREIKLVDFGMSKMQAMPDVTRTGTLIGTPQYLAPEMFRSTRADPRTDIYALGAIFYELLTDRPPYRAQTLAEVMTRQLREDIEEVSTLRQDVPTWLSGIARKCLRTDPAHSEEQLSVFVGELNDQLQSLQKAVARAVADETRLKMEIEDHLTQANEWEKRAVLALEAGNEDLAKQALLKEEEHDARSLGLQKTWQTQQAATAKLKASLQTTKEKIDEAKRKYTLMVAQYKTAATTKKVHESLSPTASESPMAMMERLGDKIRTIEAETEALVELEGGDEVGLEAKFAELERSKRGDQALEALKAKLATEKSAPAAS